MGQQHSHSQNSFYQRASTPSRLGPRSSPLMIVLVAFWPEGVRAVSSTLGGGGTTACNNGLLIIGDLLSRRGARMPMSTPKKPGMGLSGQRRKSSQTVLGRPPMSALTSNPATLRGARAHGRQSCGSRERACSSLAGRELLFRAHAARMDSCAARGGGAIGMCLDLSDSAVAERCRPPHCRCR